MRILIAFLILISIASCKRNESAEQVSLPTVTVKFANAQIIGDKYIVDVMATSDSDSLEIFGMNVRFFYDQGLLKNTLTVKDIALGYNVITPLKVNVGNVSITRPMFTFHGGANYVNGAVQKTNSNNHVYLHYGNWNKLFTIEFILVDTTKTCIPLVWDNFLGGSFLRGSEGVVITAVSIDDTGSTYTKETAEFYNWKLTGTVKYKYPYGNPLPCN